MKHIILAPDGGQHVLLRANGGVLQLELEGADVLQSSVRISFEVHGTGNLGQAEENFSVLRRILAKEHPQARATVRWTPRTRNLRDGLITFDARALGATDREVAWLLYGAQAATNDWRTGAVRERMRRNRQRGEQFVESGYRRFLA